jgi:ornithine carbamoyltransferase
MAGVRGAAREAAFLGKPELPPDPPRHFLDIDRFNGAELRSMLDTAFAYKNGRHDRPLAGKTLAMIFEKPSTRTRVSFEVAVRQLGGDAIFLNTADTQLGRGETIADTARVLSRYVDAILIRTNQPRKLDDLARYATVPVINGLTDSSHPCQTMADVALAKCRSRSSLLSEIRISVMIVMICRSRCSLPVSAVRCWKCLRFL